MNEVTITIPQPGVNRFRDSAVWLLGHAAYGVQQASEFARRGDRTDGQQLERELARLDEARALWHDSVSPVDPGQGDGSLTVRGTPWAIGNALASAAIDAGDDLREALDDVPSRETTAVHSELGVWLDLLAQVEAAEGGGLNG